MSVKRLWSVRWRIAQPKQIVPLHLSVFIFSLVVTPAAQAGGNNTSHSHSSTSSNASLHLPTRGEILSAGLARDQQSKPSSEKIADDAALGSSGHLPRIAPSIFRQLSLDGRQRIENWLSFLQENQHKTELAKLDAVNDYFNQLKYIEDNVAWKKADFWATPVEVIILNGGDCEDLAIAKYFTLRALNVSSDKMRLTFVKNFISLQSHMVLDYYTESRTQAPLVLDNMQTKIHVRHDLKAIYSFNENRVWEGRRADKDLGSPLQIERWRSLQSRLHQQHLMHQYTSFNFIRLHEKRPI